MPLLTISQTKEILAANVIFESKVDFINWILQRTNHVLKLESLNANLQSKRYRDFFHILNIINVL